MQRKTEYTVRVLFGGHDIGMVKDTNKQRALATAKRSYKNIEHFERFEFIVSEEPIFTQEIACNSIED